jgi:hypothetical protein
LPSGDVKDDERLVHPSLSRVRVRPRTQKNKAYIHAMEYPPNKAV